MRIISLSYKNRKSGWNIKDLDFNSLTLLVGASGVGKTQILHAINDLKQVARGRSLNGIQWSISFSQEGMSYFWEGGFAILDEEHYDMLNVHETPIPVEYERLYRINGKKELLIDRDSDSLRFNGQTTVKLEVVKSAIALLREEKDIAPVYNGFQQIYQVRNLNEGIRISPVKATDDTSIKDLETLRGQSYLTQMERLFLLFKHSFREFDEIKERFISVFPFVEDLSFTVGKLFNDTTYPILLLKERGVDQWIPQDRVSSGMYGTLSLLVAMTLANDGDVVLIDEFENSLGVNCIDEVTNLVLYPDIDIQFVITSHHPYIINNIDYSRWKIVTRHGSDVKVHTPDELHIGTHSKHDAFMQLIQTTAYKTGQL